MKHELKTWPEYFRVAWAGDKPFEIRLDDRQFTERDEIVLQEFIPGSGEFTGREIYGFIDYVTKFQQKDGWVVFSYHETGREDI